MNQEYSFISNDLDDDNFLIDVPVNILMTSIETQFDEPFEYRKKDYVKSFITKYENIKDNTTDDLLDDLDDMHDKFFSFIEKIFYDRLNIGFNNIDDMGDEQMHELVHMTYRFFIKNIKKNFVNLVRNFTNENQELIENNFEKKKDVTSLSFKAEIDNDYDVLLLSELGNVINFVFDELKDVDVDTFFEYCDYDEYSEELEFIKNAFDEMDLTGNFVESYINFVTPDFNVELQSKMRNKILKKYPKREKKVELIDDNGDLTEEDGEIVDNKNDK